MGKATPSLIANTDDLRARMAGQLHITRPDYIVFVPQVTGDQVSQTGNAVRTNPTPFWGSHDARVEFMRFENVDDNPDVADLKIRWFAANEKALAVPFPGHPEVSACQEPSLVKLPDGRQDLALYASSTVRNGRAVLWYPDRKFFLLGRNIGSEWMD